MKIRPRLTWKCLLYSQKSKYETIVDDNIADRDNYYEDKVEEVDTSLVVFVYQYLTSESKDYFN